LDSDNKSLILELIKEFSEKNDMAIFLVNHSYMPSIYFSNVIEITHETGFSFMDIKTIDEYGG
jgi:ABC-type lipoprotein export system ATPase subunit